MSITSETSGLPRVIVVVGPTASGKTSLAISLAKKLSKQNSAEIISADSRQIYKGMDIGTAKASREELAAIPHHLVDILDPDEEYSVAEFKNDAAEAINEIIANNHVPIVVGGTGLYIKTLVENLDIPEVVANPALRREIEAEIETQGLDALFKRLLELDPEAAYVVDPKNPRRIVRALEVALLTGKPFTEQRKKQAPLYHFLILGLNPPPEILRKRINDRIGRMMAAGLVDEVKDLVKKFGEKPVAFDAIGYREIIDYLNGNRSEENAVAAMKMDTWHFAKRQMTWFKRDKNIIWVDGENDAMNIVEKFLT